MPPPLSDAEETRLRNIMDSLAYLAANFDTLPLQHIRETIIRLASTSELLADALIYLDEDRQEG